MSITSYIKKNVFEHACAYEMNAVFDKEISLYCYTDPNLIFRFFHFELNAPQLTISENAIEELREIFGFSGYVINPVFPQGSKMIFDVKLATPIKTFDGFKNWSAATLELLETFLQHRFSPQSRVKKIVFSQTVSESPDISYTL